MAERRLNYRSQRITGFGSVQPIVPAQISRHNFKAGTGRVRLKHRLSLDIGYRDSNSWPAIDDCMFAKKNNFAGGRGLNGGKCR
jgi:hypothetical protein